MPTNESNKEASNIFNYHSGKDAKEKDKEGPQKLGSFEELLSSRRYALYPSLSTCCCSCGRHNMIHGHNMSHH